LGLRIAKVFCENDFLVIREEPPMQTEYIRSMISYSTAAFTPPMWLASDVGLLLQCVGNHIVAQLGTE
jgi:hypothetical protein